MEACAAQSSRVLHQDAGGFTARTRGVERRIGLLFTATGIGLVVVMGVLGLIMRLTQATVIDLSPAWFYRIMTLHGAGMITGVLLAMMGALWYVLHESVPLRPGRMLATYALVVGGVLAVVAATLLGGFGAGWAFLPPLPFYAAGQWSVWSESAFFAGNILVGAGFCVYCIDVLEQTTTTYGGLRRTLGLHFLFGRDENAPPPQAIAATVVAIDGLLSCAVGATILVGLLGRTYDHAVGIDALVAKNLVYFYGHSIANLTIYLAAAAIYVLVPRYAGRPYATTKVFVAGWMGSLVFIATAYSHHLYMDFVQPGWAAIISAIASYGALIPVAVVTIYSMTMLIWGSRYRWTLASTLLYIGFAGWAIGGTGAVIDSIIPINFRLHNTTWVVAHFHTYLILCVVVWALAFLAHLLERDADRTTSRAGRTLDRRADHHRRLRADRHLVRGRSARDSAPLRNPAPRHHGLQPRGQYLRAPPRARLSLVLPATDPARPRSVGSPALPPRLLRRRLDARAPQRRLGTHPRRTADGLGPRRSGVQASSPSASRLVSSPLLPSFLRSSTRPRPVLATTTSTTPASSSSARCSVSCSARCLPSRAGSAITPRSASRRCSSHPC